MMPAGSEEGLRDGIDKLHRVLPGALGMAELLSHVRVVVIRYSTTLIER
jgi:hypothetical protein